MAASHRQLARLPLEIFEPFGSSEEQGGLDAQGIRQAICQKLQSVPRKAAQQQVYEEVRTVGALLQLTLPSLVGALDPLLTYDQCHELLLRVSRHCIPPPVTAWSLLHSHDEDDGSRTLLPTPLAALNRHLRGGLRPGTLTELVGAAGVGKTQWALTVVAMAALKPRRCGSVYIDTEDKLSLPRLREISRHRSMSDTGGGDCDNDNEEARSQAVLANVTLQSVRTTDELLSCLQSLEGQILLRNHQAASASPATPQSLYHVGLVVVDSVAAPLRRDWGAASAAPQRASHALACAQILQRLAHQLDVAVLVVNQIEHQQASPVSARGDEPPGIGPPATSATAGDRGVPAPVPSIPAGLLPQAFLGTAWHHCVSTRIVLRPAAQAGEGAADDCGGSPGAPSSTTATTESVAVHGTATVTKSREVAPGGPFPYGIAGRGIIDAASVPTAAAGAAG